MTIFIPFFLRRRTPEISNVILSPEVAALSGVLGPEAQKYALETMKAKWEMLDEMEDQILNN